MREDGIRDAKRRARALLHRCGMRAPGHIRVEVYAKKLGAKIVEAPLDGAQAQLLRNGDDIHVCEVSPVSLDIAWRITREYPVSILASAIQLARLSSERCAAVFAAGGAVKWFAPSPTFTREIARGTRLDRQSVAYDFFATGKIDDRAQSVPADAWLDTSADVEIIEHSIASQEHGTTLTLLWVPEASAPPLGMAQGI